MGRPHLVLATSVVERTLLASCRKLIQYFLEGDGALFIQDIQGGLMLFQLSSFSSQPGALRGPVHRLRLPTGLKGQAHVRDIGTRKFAPFDPTFAAVDIDVDHMAREAQKLSIRLG